MVILSGVISLKMDRFHVDKFSSAHVYLRLPEGQTMDQIPPAVLEDCCQLVKANSIEGNSFVLFGSHLCRNQSK
jgi:hypothetical protein